jgi:hypothetical protein
MTRKHRFAHRIVWSVLTVLVALGFTMSLVLRPPPDPPAESTEMKPTARSAEVKP